MTQTRKNFPESKFEFIPGRRTKMKERIKRPVVSNQSMHVVLRSSLAKGKMNLLNNEAKLKRFCRKMGKNHGVRIYKLANVGNHIHIHLRVTEPLYWKGFISGLAGGIASSLGFRRSMTVGHKKRERGFWDARPYSKPISRDGYKTIQNYLELNTLEAKEIIPSRKQWNYRIKWQDIVARFRSRIDDRG